MARDKQTTKEGRERFYLDAFLKRLGLPIESVERGTDPPDFMVTAQGRRIAVEVTEHHSSAKGAKNRPRRMVEEEWGHHLLRTIRTERENFPQLRDFYARLYFKNLEVPPRKERFAFARELLLCASQQTHQAEKKQLTITDFGTEFPHLSKWLCSFRLKCVHCYMTWEWNYSAASIGLSEAELMNTVNSKLVVQFSTAFDEKWLLVTSAHQMSQAVGLPDVEELMEWQELNGALADGPYDKVYLFQYMFDRILMWRRDGNWQEVTPTKFAGNVGAS